MGMKKQSSLKTAFWHFLFKLFGGLLGTVAVPFLLMNISTALGVTTYGDYSEIRSNELASVLAATPDLSEVEIPMGIEYVLLDKSYQIIETTLDEGELEHAMRYATTGVIDQNLKKRYLLVTRENEYVVLQYYIGAQYTNEWMNTHLPSPDILLIILIAAGGIFVCLFLTTRFAKKLRLQLDPLYEATSEVAKQNLDFEVGHSNIKEFEDVLLSFSHMKESLKASLEQQWEAEHMQKEQIAALAHDLKTPLTVIQGNADLISETELDEEQRLYQKQSIEFSEQRTERKYWLHQLAEELSDYYHLSLRDKLIYKSRIESVPSSTGTYISSESYFISLFVACIILLDIIDIPEKKKFLEGKSTFVASVLPELKAYQRFVNRLIGDGNSTVEESQFQSNCEEVVKVYKYAFETESDEYYERFEISRELKQKCIAASNGHKYY